MIFIKSRRNILKTRTQNGAFRTYLKRIEICNFLIVHLNAIGNDG